MVSTGTARGHHLGSLSDVRGGFQAASRGWESLGGWCQIQGVEFFLWVAIKVFQIGIRVAVVDMVMVSNPAVLNDARQLQPEFDRPERQIGPLIFQSVGDDGLHLNRRLVKEGLVVGVTSGAELIDPDANFRLAHQEGPALLGASRRITCPA